MIPPARKEVVERKSINTSEEQEHIGKEKTPGDKGQNKTFDLPLEPIPHNGKVV